VPSTPVIPSSVADAGGGGGGKIQDTPDSTPMVVGSRRSQASSTAQWSDADKSGRLLFLHIPASLIYIYAPFLITGLFQSLLAQHGDDFKRIAASMPNKVCLVAFAS
jgi:hypothetical protein